MANRIRKIYIMEKFPGNRKEDVLEKLNSLPEGVLSNILKSFTLDENDESFKEPQTEQEKYQANYELIKIKRSLDNLDKKFDYKPFFSIFDGTKEEVLLILTTLTKDEIKLLHKKYGEDLTNTKYNEELTSEENKKIYGIIKKIKERLELYKTDNYKIIGITNLYPNTPLTVLKDSISKLCKTFQDTFNFHFDCDLERKELVHKDKIDCFISKNAINVLNNELQGVSFYIPKDYQPFIEMINDVRLEGESDEKLLERAKEALKYMPEKERDLIYQKYGEDLRNTKNVSEISRSENQKILNLYIKRLQRIMVKLSPIKAPIQCKPFTQRFDDLTTLGDILLEIEYLSEEEKSMLKAKYGEDYLGTTDNLAFSDEFNYSVKLIKEKIEKRIRRKRRDKLKLSLFAIKRILELTQIEEYMNLKSVIGINPALAVLAKKYFGDEYSTFKISELTGVDPIYIIDVTKAYLLLEQELNRKLTKEDVNVLKKRIGE